MRASPRVCRWMVGALLLWSSVGVAQVRPEDGATARQLFEQGRELAAAGKYADACPKFEESQRLDPGAGTLFNLADCYEQTGRTASAWASFLRVASESAAAKRADREKAARDRADALRPKLAQITITVADSSDGLVVKRDGTVVGKPTWGTTVPVDPGKHVIEASAPKRKVWSSTVDVPTGPNNIEVKVPALEVPAEVPVHPTPAGPSTVQTDDGSGRRTLGLVVGGAGVVAFGASVGLSLHAKSKFNDASGHCDGSACDQEGADLRHSAVSEGNVATVVGGIGLAALATGAVLYFTAPRKASSATARVTPSIALGPSSLMFRGEW